MNLVIHICTLVYVEHLFSCIWYALGEWQASKNAPNWMMDLNLEDKKWEVKYLQSFYFSTVTMFTIGFGDITPKSILI